MALPETLEEFPWGHSALKVRGKTFLFLNHSEEELSLSVKLPASRDFALIFDWAEPTGYGLGRSGWVTGRFSRKTSPISSFSNADRRELQGDCSKETQRLAIIMLHCSNRSTT